MSTRSRIGLLLPDGRVRSIYCHSDGYPSYTGRLLQDHWRESVLPLLALGDLSLLGEVLGRDEGPDTFDARRGWSDDDPRHAWCLAYGRDRGERDTDAREHARTDWPDSGWEYLYLWTGQEWLVRAKYTRADAPTRWTKLTRVLARLQERAA